MIKNENKPPHNSPSPFFFKIPIVLLLANFFSTLGSAIQFYQKFDIGRNIDFFRFLGFFEMEMKSFRKKVCLFFTKSKGKGEL